MTVMLDDGTEEPIHSHMREVHGKGTQGLTEEFLGNMHEMLHQRHAPDLEHIHAEPDEDTTL
jgi:hypothetical protein